MVLMEKIVATFAQTAVTNSAIRTRATVFVKTVAGDNFVNRHVLCSVVKIYVILVQAIVTVVLLDTTDYSVTINVLLGVKSLVTWHQGYAYVNLDTFGQTAL